MLPPLRFLVEPPICYRGLVISEIPLPPTTPERASAIATATRARSNDALRRVLSVATGMKPAVVRRLSYTQLVGLAEAVLAAVGFWKDNL